MKKTERNCRRTLRAAIVLSAIFFAAPVARLSAQDAHGKVDLLHVQGNVYMIAGAGANITV